MPERYIIIESTTMSQFLNRVIARTQKPTEINCASEYFTFGNITEVNPTRVQWLSSEGESQAAIGLVQYSFRILGAFGFYMYCTDIEGGTRRANNLSFLLSALRDEELLAKRLYHHNVSLHITAI